MRLKHLGFIGGLVLTILAAALPSFGQSNPRYVRFAGVPNAVKGALYSPDAAPKPPHVGILVMHRASNFMNTLACTELSKRGFLVLCMNPRSDNNEAQVRWETIPLDVKPASNGSKSSRVSPRSFSGGSAAAGRR